MNGLDLNKVKDKFIQNCSQQLEENLHAIFLSGSVASNSHTHPWSDIDLLVVVEHLDLKVKNTLAIIISDLEKNSGIHHGLNVIVASELYNPVKPSILLDGKTLQALVDIRKYPERVIFSKNPLDMRSIFLPSEEEIKDYSFSNIGMFLRRNRRTLTTKSAGTFEEYKELLKKEIRTGYIMTKLAVQYVTGIPQDSNEEVVKEAKNIFPDFDFNTLDLNKEVIQDWGDLNDRSELEEVFNRTDKYIEDFAMFIFEHARNK